mmetsp:Transcript_44550/g.112716  ORF Transcript_44550/g.112716 Transcript_44550/m.112716 type:complete len:466 (-) Transcript_44550:135-1532(-)
MRCRLSHIQEVRLIDIYPALLQRPEKLGVDGAGSARSHGLQAQHLIQRRVELFHARPVHRAREDDGARHRGDPVVVLLQPRADRHDANLQLLLQLVRILHVHLVQHHDVRPRGVLRVVHAQLLAYREVVRHGVLVRGVDDVHQHARAAQVAEEHKAEAAPLVGALDQARQIRQDGRVAARLQDPQVGHQRGERVRRHLRLGFRHGRQQAALPRVGKADDADVRDDAQQQPHRQLLPVLPVGVLPPVHILHDLLLVPLLHRVSLGPGAAVDLLLPRWRHHPDAALAAPDHRERVAGLQQLPDQPVAALLADLCPWGHVDHQRLRPLEVLAAGFGALWSGGAHRGVAVGALRRSVHRPAVEMRQGVDHGVGAQNHAASVTAVGGCAAGYPNLLGHVPAGAVLVVGHPLPLPGLRDLARAALPRPHGDDHLVEYFVLLLGGTCLVGSHRASHSPERHRRAQRRHETPT